MPHDQTVGEYDYFVEASDDMVRLMEDDDRIEILRTEDTDWGLDMGYQNVWFNIVEGDSNGS
jgi:hypothetical protein